MHSNPDPSSAPLRGPDDSAELTADDVQVLVRLTARALATPVAFLVRLDGGRLRTEAWHGPDLAASPRVDELCREALLERDLFIVPDVRERPRRSRRPLTAKGADVRFFAAVPLRAGEETAFALLGVLDFDPRRFSDERRRALRDMADLALTKLDASSRRHERSTSATRSNADGLADDDEDTDQIHSQEHYSSVVKVMAEGILMRDAEGRVLTCNTAAERILGLTRDQLTGRAEVDEPPWKLIREDGTPFPEEEYPSRATLRTGVPCSDVIMGLAGSDGRVKWISVNTQPMQRPDAAQPHAVVASFSDITHLKQTQRALKTALRSTEELQTLFEIADALFCIAGFDGFFKQLNPAWERTFGHPIEDLCSRPYLDFVHPDDRESTRREVERLTEGKHMRAFESRFRHRDGSYRWLSWNATPDPETGHLYAVTVDVTQQRKARAEREALIHQLEEKNAELERYTYTVSHDLKSPLLTIRGFLGYIEKSAVKGDVEQLRADMARVVSAAERMQQLLDELLELSRIGRFVHPPQEVSLTRLAREAAELVHCGEGSAEIAVPDALPVVHCDPTRLRQVFQNLLDNALKFMGAQSAPRVEIGARKHPGETVCRVRDNGAGIDPRYLDQVFGLFKQIDPGSGGTGVGLALVRRIIEVHGGRVWVESDGPDRGACFYFTLPDEPPWDGSEADDADNAPHSQK